MSNPSPRALKAVVVVAGMIAAVVSVLLLNSWLKHQGDDEVTVTAAWALHSSEAQLGRALAALDGLAARGIDSCEPASLHAMRQTALTTAAVKQVLLVGGDGGVPCTDAGGPQATPDVLASAAIDPSGAALDLIQLPGSGSRLLRVRLRSPDGKPSLAALVSPVELLPNMSVRGSPMHGLVRMSMADGTPVGEAGSMVEGPAPPAVATVRSTRFPLVITASFRGKSVVADSDDLRRISIVVTAVLALVVLLFALLFARRRSADPAADMAKAIRDDEFVPYYQPLVDLQNGKLLGAEVLVRWKRGGGDMIEPKAFVLMLESSGLVLDLTRRLMKRVRQELGDALAARPAMTIAFNVAPRHFDDALILSDLGDIFDGSGVRLSQIVLELTERHEVTNLTNMRRTIAALQRIGCKVAIDDVGTGHSGLSYILKLGVDIIKIDKLFVEAIGLENHTKAIIETLIDLAKNMRMEIVAEGVETFDQVTYLRERGIGAAQGYVFAPPLPASSFLQLLDAMDPVTPAAGRGAPQMPRPAAKPAPTKR